MATTPPAPRPQQTIRPGPWASVRVFVQILSVALMARWIERGLDQEDAHERRRWAPQARELSGWIGGEALPDELRGALSELGWTPWERGLLIGHGAAQGWVLELDWIREAHETGAWPADPARASLSVHARHLASDTHLIQDAPLWRAVLDARDTGASTDAAGYFLWACQSVRGEDLWLRGEVASRQEAQHPGERAAAVAQGDVSPGADGWWWRPLSTPQTPTGRARPGFQQLSAHDEHGRPQHWARWRAR